MKTIYKIATLCLLLLAVVSCDKRDNSFDVSGDCKIESLVMDDIYTGVVNHAARTVVVGVPEVHDDREAGRQSEYDLACCYPRYQR